MPISVYIVLNEYHYLGTRKPNKRIYPAILDWRVLNRLFCRSRKMLQNEPLVAKIGVDTAENGPRKECCVDTVFVCTRSSSSLESMSARCTTQTAQAAMSLTEVTAPSPLLARPGRCRPRHSTLSEARSRLYQHRFLQPNTHFAAFCEIYKMS